jgi:TRAP-type C4-dicarboxylate transport system substrate-binding protein
MNRSSPFGGIAGSPGDRQVMCRLIRRMLAVGLALATIAPLAAQAPLRLRLATLAPENSPWHTALADMGSAWNKATAGRVVLTIFPGSSIASESSAIAKMNPAVDGLQAATLTVSGLGEIDNAFNVFGMPFFFQSDAELEDIQAKLTPMLSSRLEARGYHLINWGNAGWVQLFSKMPIRTLQDAKQAKLYTTEGEPRTVQWYTQNGFHAVPLKQSEIPAQLKSPTGSINAAPSPPYFALALQFYRDAPYMLDLRVAPLTSATVITDRAWAQISADDRTKMLAVATMTQKKIQTDAPALDANAIRDMKDSTKAAKVPFQVITLNASAAAQFRAEADRMTASQRGMLVPDDVFDAAMKERTAFRLATATAR